MKATLFKVAGLYTDLQLSRFHPPLAHVITSNVPGPPEEIYCAGSRVLDLHAVAPLCEGTTLNITAVSYGGTFAVGIVACPDNVDDGISIARGIEDVVAELKKTADKKPGQSRRNDWHQTTGIRYEVHCHNAIRSPREAG